MTVMSKTMQALDSGIGPRGALVRDKLAAADLRDKYKNLTRSFIAGLVL